MIRSLHQQLKNREITSVALTQKYLDAIKTKDGEIGAYLTVLEESALQQAAEVDKKFDAGEEADMLTGIPCAIKDNILMTGVRTTAGSKMLEEYIAPYDATVISHLRKNGAIMLGKTNLDEFAMGSSTENSAYKVTHNPIDLERVPGGSSGGSAAAVAGDMAVWSLGSDTGGSIRQPASFCGLVGVKPTYGRVSRSGLIAMASSFDQIGPLATTVEDAAIVLSRIAGYDRLDATTAESEGKYYEQYLTGDIKGVKIGVPKEYLSENLDTRVRFLIEQSLEKFRSKGAIVESIDLSESRYALPTYYIAIFSEISSNLARLDGIRYGLQDKDAKTLLDIYRMSRAEGFGTEVERRIMLGTYTLSAGYYDAYYKKAQAVRKLLRQSFERAFEKVDFIFSPTTPEPAFKIGAKTSDPLTMYLSDIYTVTANLVGVPAISFPMGTVTEEGKPLPVGGQLMAKWYDEEGMLNCADAFERK
ncbi:MAG: Asp-tRNA(Asn)/Glu-tRNA(Gln) amidotransferase subunit GatA [Candidatus Moraniibacteriota bacterium]